LDEAEEVLWVVLPLDKYAALPLDPGKKAFNQPASGVSVEAAVIASGRIFQDDCLLIRRRFGFPASPKLELACSRKTTLIWA
jgi:hypothetical protein